MSYKSKPTLLICISLIENGQHRGLETVQKINHHLPVDKPVFSFNSPKEKNGLKILHQLNFATAVRDAKPIFQLLITVGGDLPKHCENVECCATGFEQK